MSSPDRDEQARQEQERQEQMRQQQQQERGSFQGQQPGDDETSTNPVIINR